MILYMSVVTVHMVYFSACALSSLFVNHYITLMFSPQNLKKLIFKFQSEQVEQVDFIFRSRSILVASLSGGVHVHVHEGCFDLCKH